MLSKVVLRTDDGVWDGQYSPDGQRILFIQNSSHEEMGIMSSIGESTHYLFRQFGDYSPDQHYFAAQPRSGNRASGKLWARKPIWVLNGSAVCFESTAISGFNRDLGHSAALVHHLAEEWTIEVVRDEDINGLAASHDGEFLLVASTSGVRLFRLNAKEVVLLWTDNVKGGEFWGMSVSSDRLHCAYGTSEGVYIRRSDGYQAGFIADAYRPAWRPHTDEIAYITSYDEGEQIRFYSTTRHRVIGGTNKVVSGKLNWSPDGRLLTINGCHKTSIFSKRDTFWLTILVRDTGDLIDILEGSVNCVSWSPDSKHLLVSHNGQLLEFSI
ncbi:MAG: hypothetical protein IAE80_13720 [Anaerolinea sp.]|nr:hypothetical protein [Anaerolinea sp.]